MGMVALYNDTTICYVNGTLCYLYDTLCYLYDTLYTMPENNVLLVTCYRVTVYIVFGRMAYYLQWYTMAKGAKAMKTKISLAIVTGYLLAMAIVAIVAG